MCTCRQCTMRFFVGKYLYIYRTNTKRLVLTIGCRLNCRGFWDVERRQGHKENQMTTYVPLLHKQAELYALPQGWERFQAYLGTMLDAAQEDIVFPWSAMNPMGREHLSQRLERYIELKADAIAAQVVAAFAEKHPKLLPSARVTLVLVDDAKGGWTNRYSTEFEYRFKMESMHKRDWIPVFLWTSEEPDPQSIRNEVTMCLFRNAYIQKKGYARNLRSMLEQERFAMRHAGLHCEAYDPEELEYTRAIIQPYWEVEEHSICMTALFGDAATRELGFMPLGFAPRAGLLFACHGFHEEK